MKNQLLTKISDPSDIDALVELYSGFRDSLQRTAPSNEDFHLSLGVLLRTPGVRLYLALKEGRALGYAAQRFWYSAWASGKEALLEDLYVRPEYRGLGVGGKLVEHAIRDATENGCKAMSLDTNENNAASNALYLRLGFTCKRARWEGGRQIRYDLKLVKE